MLKDNNAKANGPKGDARTLSCPKCGHENDLYALRCDACGELLDAMPAPQADAVPMDGMEAPPPPPPPAPATFEAPPAAPPPPSAAPRTDAPAGPVKARIRDDYRLCPKCGQATEKGAPRCSKCGMLLGVSRMEITARQEMVTGYMGAISLIIAILAVVLVKTSTKITLVGGIIGIITGILALNREEQAGLGVLAIIVGILDVFIVIVAPMA